MARRRFSERDVIEVLAWQGIAIRCFRCGHPLMLVAAADDKVVWPHGPAEREHLHEVKLGGPDIPENCRYSHAKCHARITNGTKATTAGSSKQRIAKVARILAGGRKRKGPPIKSRGFDKRFTKRMSGTIERRNT